MKEIDEIATFNARSRKEGSEERQKVQSTDFDSECWENL